jgi:uncharacterized protein (DUF2252 family)
MVCGDCHIGNLGPVASVGGKLAVQIRDLDQAVVGNPVHDLVRLGLSLAMAARGTALPGVTTARMMERMMNGYETAFATTPTEAAEGDARKMPCAIELVMRKAQARSWKHLADERIEDVKPKTPLGKRFWPLTEEESAAVQGIFADQSVRRSSPYFARATRVLSCACWMLPAG